MKCQVSRPWHPFGARPKVSRAPRREGMETFGRETWHGRETVPQRDRAAARAAGSLGHSIFAERKKRFAILLSRCSPGTSERKITKWRSTRTTSWRIDRGKCVLASV